MDLFLNDYSANLFNGNIQLNDAYHKNKCELSFKIFQKKSFTIDYSQNNNLPYFLKNVSITCCKLKCRVNNTLLLASVCSVIVLL